MIEKLKGLLFPEKSNWQDLAVHTLGAKVVLVQVRVKINGAKQFRSVEVCEFMRPSDITADMSTAIINGLKEVKPIVPRKPYTYTDRKAVAQETTNGA